LYSIDQITNAHQLVRLAGKEFSVRQLKLREWGELQGWLKSVAPSPIAVAARGIAELKAAGATPTQEIQDAIFHQAQAEARTWPPRVASPEWFKAIDMIDGGHGRLVMAALKAGGEEIDDDDADDLAQAASSAELIDLVRVCVHGEHIVPKAAAVPPTPSVVPPSPTTGDGFTSGSDRSTG
jgi:hypothetical protein